MNEDAIRVNGPNPAYAELMLSNIGGANSEISAVAHYFYNRLRTQDEYSHISDLFRKISIEEMHHLEAFGRLAMLLGADPRLWETSGVYMRYWSPEEVDYTPRSAVEIVRTSIDEELAAIDKYTVQAAYIQDPYAVEVLRRVVADEERHIRLFQDALKKMG